MIGLIIFIAYSSSAWFNEKKINYYLDSKLINEYFQSCNNLTLPKSAGCTNNLIRKFFIYNDTPDSKLLRFHELIERGGDCRDWALLYEDLGNELNFNVLTPVMKINNNESHRIAIWSNDDGFCILDQKNYVCFKNEKIQD